MTAETNAERLDEIKSTHQWGIESSLADRGLSDSDIDWLIQQAERAQELEKEIDVTRWDLAELSVDLMIPAKENARLREALEFYAKEESYYTDVSSQWQPVIAVNEDSGKIARQALKGESQ